MVLTKLGEPQDICILLCFYSLEFNCLFWGVNSLVSPCQTLWYIHDLPNSNGHDGGHMKKRIKFSQSHFCGKPMDEFSFSLLNSFR